LRARAHAERRARGLHRAARSGCAGRCRAQAFRLHAGTGIARRRRDGAPSRALAHAPAGILRPAMADATDEKEDKTLLQELGAGLRDFIKWTFETLVLDPHERALKALVDDLGGTLKAPPKFPSEPSLTQLEAFIEAPRPGIEAWIVGIRD